jgi:hypothetical protein
MNKRKQNREQVRKPWNQCLSLILTVVLLIVFGTTTVLAEGGGPGSPPTSQKLKKWGIFPLGDTYGVSRLSDKAIPFHGIGKIPKRPHLLTELGDNFLDTGHLFPGFTLPTGAVWQPRLWVYGIYRTAIQTFENGRTPRSSEWVHRYDFYSNLQLTGTERIFYGVRPLDKNRFEEFTRWEFEQESGGRGEFNLNLRTLFFEGDLGSVFPFLDKKGMRPLDLGFSVGRQNINFQDGIMINDDLDALGLVRNNLRLPFIPASNIRTTAVWGWNGNDRGGGNSPVNRGRPEAQVLGLFNSLDMHKNTLNIDGIYTIDDKPSGGDTVHFGISTIQRVGRFNTTFRSLSSFALEATTPQTGKGTVVTGEISWTPHASDDNIYINPFWAFGNFTQAGREPILGGALAPLGILFASPNLGNFRSELVGVAQDAFGGAIGYQAFWNYHHTNLTLELAGTKDTGGGLDQAAIGFQFQQKMGRHLQFQVDGHYGVREDTGPLWGARSEILFIL